MPFKLRETESASWAAQVRCIRGLYERQPATAAGGHMRGQQQHFYTLARETNEALLNSSGRQHTHRDAGSACR